MRIEYNRYRPPATDPARAGANHDVTRAAAAFVAGTTRELVPPDVADVARRAVLDTVGVMLAGVGEDASWHVRKVAVTPTPAGPCTVVGTRLRASAADAALANGTAAHALDFDDTQDNVRGHPSAPILAAALAVAELLHRPGGQLVTAYAVGLEIAGKAGRALGRSHAAAGFHSTSTVGVLGAAAAASNLVGLDPEHTATALAIAASGASGLRRNFGTMTKPLHVGDAARRGVLAALLAARDFGAATGVFDGPGSFVQVFSPGGDAHPELLTDLGDPWEAIVPGVAVKKYPCCNRGHRALDAVLTVRSRLGVTTSEDVAGVSVRMPAGQVDAEGRVGPMTCPRPRTGLEAKFSMQYVVAAALADGAVSVRSFTDDAVGRRVVRDLASRVVPESDPDREGGGTQDFVEVEVRLVDGRRDAERVWFPRGDPRGGVPLTDAEMREKFRDCATSVLPAGRVDRVVETVSSLDRLPDVGELLALLRLDREPDRPCST